jgi:ligand-binding sensor domain-containing protein
VYRFIVYMARGIKWQFLVLVLASSMSYAQKTYRFENITVNEGLSQSSVTSIAQDASGYLWIGTQDGLNKYDGYSIKVYRNKEEDSTSLAKNYVSKILVDEQNAIWIATLGHLSKYNLATDGFTNYPLAVDGQSISPNVFIWDIFRSRDGRFVLSTTSGIIHFNPSTEKFQLENEFLSSFGKVVYSYCETRSQGDWIFLMHNTLHRPPGSKVWAGKQTLGNRSYYDSHLDRLFYYDEPGRSALFKYDSSGEWVEWTELARKLSSLEICFTASGNIWVAADNGIFIYDSSGRLLTSITAFEISTTGVNQAKAIYESRDGVIWLGTNGYGLKKYNPQTNQFSYLGSSTTSSLHLSHSYVDAIYTDDDTTVYVTTPNGLDVLNLVTKSSRHFPQQIRIKSIIRDKGQLWLCGSDDLWLFKNNQFIETNLHNSQTITPYPSRVMAFVGEAHISVLDHGKKEYLLKQPLVTDITVLNVIGDTLWVGTGPGTSLVKLFDLTTRQLLKDFSHDPENSKSFPSGGGIKCIFQDSKKRIWIGSAGGLILYNAVEKNFAHFTEQDGLPNNTIYGILEDDQHNLWLSSNKGLCEFNPETKKVRNYEAFDGLQSNEFNTGAAFKSKSGVMYFGGVNGVTYFHPRDLDSKNYIHAHVYRS